MKRSHLSTTIPLIAAGILAFSAPAKSSDLLDGVLDQSADQPAGVTVNWTGAYAGVHGGWAQGEWDGKLETTAGNPPDNDAGYDNPFKSLDGEGWNGGGQLGYNHQIGNIVIGAEIDASWTDFSGSEVYTTDDYNGDYAKHHSFELDYFGTARLRTGVDMGRFMPYITGGLAIGRSQGDLSISYPNAPLLAGETSDASATQNHIGWTLGGGLEAMLGGGWSVKAEYLYVDLGKQDYDFKGSVFNGDPFETDSFDSDLKFDVWRAGLNFRF